MNYYFSAQSRRLQLVNEASTWIGTPFHDNAGVKGAGVSCQKLIGALYIHTGVWPEGFEIPDGPMNWSNAHEDSLITAAMEKEITDGRFMEVLDSAAIPGDLVGFKIGGCLHHLGLVLASSGMFIHCLRNMGTRYNELRDATYLSRIQKIWRPL